MKHVLFGLSAVSLIAISATPTWAQLADRQGAEDPGSDRIIVTANRTQRAISQVGESVTVVDEEEIITRQPSELIDILRTVPGVTFNRNGGAGTNTGVSIRGADADQTLVLIDGVKINDPSSPGGGFNFGPLMVGNIARVEVVRGSQSVLYGSQAIGGVVNLISRAPSEDVEAYLSTQYGERDTAELVGNISGKVGPVAASLGANYFRTEGISAFNEVRGGTELDGFETVGLNGKIDIALTDNLSLDLRGFFADGETEIDGFAPPTFAFGDTNDVSYQTDFVGYAGLNASFLDGRFRNRLAFAYTRIDRNNVNRDTNFESVDAQGENRRFEYQGVFDADDIAEIVFGAEREESDFNSVSFGSLTGGSAWINSVYGQVTVNPAEGLALTGGLRFDDHETFGSATTAAGSFAYTPNDGNTLVRASYSEGFNAPALFQLFSSFGNTALLPEESDSWDIGVTQSLLDGKAQIGVTYFERDATNQIDFVSCFGSTLAPCQVANPPFGTYDNIDLTSANGWEIGLVIQPVSGLDLALNYTQIDAIDDTNGLRLARRAEDTVSLVADYETASGFGIGTTILVVGDSFDDVGNTRPLDGYVVADIRASYEITEQFEVFGRIENVTNEQYETIFQYGVPGRAVFGGVRFRM